MGYLGLLPVLGLYTLLIVSGLVQTPAPVKQTIFGLHYKG